VLRKAYPNLTQVAVFDTAFHQSIPEYAALYPIPYDLSQRSNIRRYGFHGTSHAYVAKKAADMMNKDLEELNLITLHLGNGASATAIKAGKSIDTSMGLTPLEGLMMGTRCGNIDPSIITFLSNNHNTSISEIDRMLNKESGLKGICGTNDMREVITRSEQGDDLSILALKMYIHRIKKYIGAYTVILGHVDAIIFTGGIGEHAAKVREMVCKDMDGSIGLKVDLIKNKESFKTKQAIHDKESRIQILVIPTDEELEIALQTEKMI
jgi:acetate kinase